MLKKISQLQRNYEAISNTNKSLLDDVKNMKTEVESIAIFKKDLEDDKKRTAKEAEQKVLRLKLENETMRMTIKKITDDSTRANNANANILKQFTQRVPTVNQETQTYSN